MEVFIITQEKLKELTSDSEKYFSNEWSIVRYDKRGRNYCYYSKLLQHFFWKPTMVLENQYTKNFETVSIQTYRDAYFDGFEKGQAEFEDTKKLYSNDIDVLVTEINSKHDDRVLKSEMFNMVVTTNNFYNIGLYAGLRFEAEEFYKNHSAIFEKYLNSVENVEKTPFFNTDLSDASLLKIMKLLTEMPKGLKKDTDSGLWLYWFNRNPLHATKEPLIWEGTPAKISNIIQTICKTAEADSIMAAFGVTKVGCSASKYANFEFIIKIKQILIIDKQKKIG